MKEIDLLRIVQKEFKMEVMKGLVNEIGPKGMTKLMASKDDFFLIIDFLLLQKSLSDSDKTYKDFRDDARLVFNDLDQALKAVHKT